MRVASQPLTLEQYVETYRMADFLNDDLLRHLQLFHFPAYSNVFIEQDEQQFLYFLVEGQVQCNRYHLNGKLAVLAVSHPFAALGDLEILSNEPVRHNVVTTQDSTLLGISREHVERYGAKDPHFLRFLVEQLSEKLYHLDNLQIHHALPLINQLAVYLLAQSNSADSDMVMLPDKEGLASLLGATPRHLNRVLRQMVEAGAISDGYPLVYILDKATLENLMR